MNKIKLLLGLCIYKIAPVIKNRYVFTSFNGHYSDNTKAISIKLHEMDEHAEIIWLVDESHKNDVPEYAKTIDIHSLKSFWYRGTATTQIDNVYGFRALFKMSESKRQNFVLKLISFLCSKKRQPIFTTMHGTPMKRLGRDQIGNVVLDMYCSNTYLLVGDKLTADVLQRVTFNKIPISVLGSPRNDILFQDVEGKRVQLGLPTDKKILLFAPTFRNDGRDVEGKNIYRSGLNQLSEIDFEQLFETMSRKFGGEWVLVCRFHYHVANMVNWDELNTKYPGKFINGNQYDDMADYLACTDVLMTDSSSCMFDFCHTLKPCFLYFPDLENYRSNERGFYIDIEDLPFPTSVKFDKLIQDIENFDQNEYEDGVGKLLTSIGSQNDGNASKRVVERIFEMCKR